MIGTAPGRVKCAFCLALCVFAMRGGGFTYRVAATPYVNKKPGDCPVRSVNIPLIAPRLAQFVEIIGGGVRVHAALAGDDVKQRALNVFCHASRVATDVHIGAVLEPLPHARRFFAQFVLHVHFLRLVARPRQAVAVQEAVFLPALPFGLVEEVFGEVRVAEHQPVFPRCLMGDARLHEGAEGRDAGAVANHDDGGVGVVRQAEVRVRLDEDAHHAVFRQAFAEVARRR